MNVCAVLPCAGNGERMGSEMPKQFINILNQPIISHTLVSFERVSWIRRVVVVVAPECVSLMEQIVSQYGHQRVSVVCGASTRHRSIRRGLQQLDNDDQAPDVVVIHDAVRLFVTENLLHDVCFAAAEFGACGVVKPLVSTVVAVDETGFMDHALERSRYRASEMPQAFRFADILQAYKQATEDELDYGTECLFLAQKYCGAKVKLVDGSCDLWKVTHRRDLYAAAGMLKERDNVVGLCTSPSSVLREGLETSLKAKNLKHYVLDDVAAMADGTNDVIVHLNVPEDSAVFNEALAGLATARDHPRGGGSGGGGGGGAIVAVVVCAGAKQQSGSEALRKNLTRLLGKARVAGVCINGVVCTTDAAAVRAACDIAASLVFDRNLMYSGQVFIVP